MNRPLLGLGIEYFLFRYPHWIEIYTGEIAESVTIIICLGDPGPDISGGSAKFMRQGELLADQMDDGTEKFWSRPCTGRVTLDGFPQSEPTG